MNTSILTKTEETVISGDTYLQDLLKQGKSRNQVENAAIVDLIRGLNQQATDLVLSSAIPTKREEGWRFTDLSELTQTQFQRAEFISVSSVDEFILPEATHSRLVFVNGIYAPELSDVSGLPDGIYAGNLENLPENQSNKLPQYLAQQKGANEVFTALNTASLKDATVVWVNPNITVEIPIHLLFLSVTSNIPNLIQPRTLVVAETGSNITLVEYYGAIAEGCSDTPHNHPYFTNAVTEIWIQENAQVNHSRIQRESGDGFHIGKSAITQARDSRYTHDEISLGGKLYRHNLEIFQTGEQTDTKLNGLIIIGGKQVADTHSAVYLTQPYGTTNQLHKCIIDDHAHAIFNGKVFVPKAAQLTNAAQLNRNLLLSPKARVNTKPELQITADNVKCSHGATVSQLEADEVFYLQSRGLNEYDARHLLIDAFAAEILDNLPLESLRHRLKQCVACRTIG